MSTNLQGSSLSSPTRYPGSCSSHVSSSIAKLSFLRMSTYVYKHPDSTTIHLPTSRQIVRSAFHYWFPQLICQGTMAFLSANLLNRSQSLSLHQIRDTIRRIPGAKNGYSWSRSVLTYVRDTAFSFDLASELHPAVPERRCRWNMMLMGLNDPLAIDDIVLPNSVLPVRLAGSHSSHQTTWYPTEKPTSPGVTAL